MTQTFYLAVEQYQVLYDKALEMYHLFEDVDAAELQRRTEEINGLVDRFLSVSGLTYADCGNLGRHLHFIRYYLKQNDREACKADIFDIVFSDLPTTLKKLIQDFPSESHLDEKLKNSVLPLIHDGHYDSAIRKSFVVLTDRLRRAFGVGGDVDGDHLVNAVFGGKGKVELRLDDTKKQAYRNLFSGFYAVYRNRHAHADIEPSLAEVKAIIEMTNNLLIEIEEIASQSVEDQS